MKYSSYSFPVTQYSPSRYSSYTPSATHSTPSASVYTHTPSTHTHTSYTPSSKLGSRLHSSSDISSLTAKYLPASYTSPPSHYTPSHTSLSSSSSSYSSLASYFRPPRYTPARKPSGKAATATAAKPNPDSAPQPVKQVRTVRFPNDIMFQDFVRKGELEQIGRFMRARKVRLDKLFLSGEAHFLSHPRHDIIGVLAAVPMG